MMVVTLTLQMTMPIQLMTLTRRIRALQYYTGLPSYEILEAVFKFQTAGLPDSFAMSSSNIFYQFLMVVLTRLRLNTGIKDLGYQFDVHHSTVCQYFS